MEIDDKRIGSYREHIQCSHLSLKLIAKFQFFLFNNKHVISTCSVQWFYIEQPPFSSSGVPRQNSRLLIFSKCHHRNLLPMEAHMHAIDTYSAGLPPSSYCLAGFHCQQQPSSQWSFEERESYAAALGQNAVSRSGSGKYLGGLGGGYYESFLC